MFWNILQVERCYLVISLMCESNEGLISSITESSRLQYVYSAPACTAELLRYYILSYPARRKHYFTISRVTEMHT